MVGDNLETDIELGINAGVDTLFVLSGVSTLEEMQENIKNNGILPKYYSEHA